MGRHRLIPPPPVRKLRRLLVALTLVALTITGCGSWEKIQEPYNDAPRGRQFDGPADVVNMPDGFSNLATKCGPGGNRYTVVFKGDQLYGSVSVVPDPGCQK